MIYLDYSATTPVNEEVMKSFCKVSRDYIGNANSLHKLGMDSKKLMEQATNQIASLLNVKPSEVIFVSSASEANNMVLKGTLEKYKNRGKHVITTKLEHSSILDTCSYLESIGYDIDYVSVDNNGQVNLEELASLIKKDTVLVSIHQVNSEVGALQDIDAISKVIKNKNPLTYFHVDGTQSVGKIPVSLENIDLFTFSAHKIYGLKGIAVLIKKQNILLTPLIHGGKSQTEFRSGTPAVGLMVSCAKALRLALENLDEKYKYVNELNTYLKEELSKIDGVTVNSSFLSIPHILNISVSGIKSEVMLHALEQEEIYISTKTACSKDSSASLSLLAMGKSDKIAEHSLRISLSHLTTKEEVNKFLEVFKLKIQELSFRREK